MEMRKILFLFLMLAGLAVGADEIQVTYTSDNTLYFRVRNSACQVWNTSGTPAFEAWSDGNVTDYDVTLTDGSGGHYRGTFPATVSAGRYSVEVFLQIGATAAVTDVVLGPGEMVWNGSAEVFVIDSDGKITSDVSAADVVDEWETQSQADPTGFHVNLMEIEGAGASDSLVDMMWNSLLIDHNENGSFGQSIGLTSPFFINGLNDFDPANDTVENVTLVGTTTTNSDMRGTDNGA